MLITYTNREEEVIVCTSETEKEVLQAFFTEGGRDLKEYERTIHKDVGITIKANLHVW